MAEVSFSLPAKRKRGRPRKDGNIFRQGCLQLPENLTPVKTRHAEVAYPASDGNVKTQEADKSAQDSIVDGMVGSMICGVIEGSFDAGYFISVRIGNNNTAFRGVVFQPQKFVPVTPANDVAPQAKMYHRRDIPVPAYNDFSQISGMNPQPEKGPLQPVQPSKQAAVCPVLPPYSVGNHSNFMASEPVMLRTNSCSNMGGTVTVPKSPTIGMLEQHDNEGPKKNMETMGDMISGSSSLKSVENVNQKTEVHEKIGELGPGQSFLEGMTQSAFSIQPDNKMSYRELDCPRESAIELRETSLQTQVQSFPREPETSKTDLYYNGLRNTDVNFPEYLLTDHTQQDSQQRSPNLKLDLSSVIHEKKPLEPQGGDKSCIEANYLALNGLKSTNVGYHQALVSGNPLLLPPEIVTTSPPDFMLDKPKSVSDSRIAQETNMELESRFHESFAGDSMAKADGGPQLELGGPQSNTNKQTGSSGVCMSSYMDFVLGDVVQTTESRGHTSELSESKQG